MCDKLSKILFGNDLKGKILNQALIFDKNMSDQRVLNLKLLHFIYF